MQLTCDETIIGALTSSVTIPFNFQHGGTQLRIGFDRGFPVVDDYEIPSQWPNPIRFVVVDASAHPYPPNVETISAALRND
jgi:hypothetical protein